MNLSERHSGFPKSHEEWLGKTCCGSFGLCITARLKNENYLPDRLVVQLMKTIRFLLLLSAVLVPQPGFWYFYLEISARVQYVALAKSTLSLSYACQIARRQGLHNQGLLTMYLVRGLVFQFEILGPL